MYPHEEDSGKNKYLIIALCFHIALILSFFVFKGVSAEAEVVQAEEPPESSTQDNAEMTDDNRQSIEDLQKQQEINKLKQDSMVANSIPAQEVEKAINDNNNRIESEKKAIEDARKEKLRKIEEAKEQKRQDEIAIKKKIEEDKKQAEEAKQEKIRQDKERDEEKKRLEKEKADKAEQLQEEKERQEKIEKAKKLEDAKKIEEDRKRKSAEAIKKAEDEKRADQVKENQLKKKAAEAGRSSANNKGYDSDKPSLSNNEKLAYLRAYRDDVYNSVYSNWIRPSYSKRGWECKVYVTQTNTGKVVDVKIVSCQGDTEFQNSVKKAIFKSSPLPLPKHPSLFNEMIEIKFKVT